LPLSSAEFQARIEELFFAAVDLPPSERAGFLDRECMGEPELRSQTQSLLESDDRASCNVLWQESAMQAAARCDASDETELRIGQRLGSYRILRRLGAGGMGVVYEAVRDDHEFEKRVAIKLVQLSLASPRVLERLRSERQILANLEHPFIARLLDGGTTPDGLPYLVMELVEGQPIDQFLRGLTRDARLKVYVDICNAVAYAHQHLVVHRDLKPGNILVSPDGTPKLLDFGIAQLLDSGTSTCDFGSTPSYASPEQKEGLRASIASDVFSLGVLLRELIPPQWLDADLAAIVAKAVQENPADRYPSVDRLAGDVNRFMQGRTVLARQQGIGYRTGKFLRRRKIAVSLAVGSLALAAVGAIGIIRSNGSARRDRVTAGQLANTDAFQPGGPLSYAAGSTAVRKSVDQRSVDSLERLLQEAPGDQTIQRELALAYQRLALMQGTVFSANLGARGDARATMEKAFYLRERLFDANRASALDRGAFVETLAYLGRMAISDGEPSEAYRLHMRAWSEAEPLIARGQLDEPFHIAARAEYLLGIDLGGIGYSPHLGDPAGALAYHTDALRLLERWAKAHAATQTIGVELALREELVGIDLCRLWRYAEAEAHMVRALALLPHAQPSMVSAGDPRTWCALRSCYAWILTEEGKGREAAKFAREAMQGAARLVEADPANVRAQLDLSIAEGVSARAACQVGESRKALDHFNRVIDDQEMYLKVDPWRAELRGALARHYLWAGACALHSGNWRDAQRRFEAAADLTTQTIAAHSSDANARENLAAAHRGLARTSAHFGKTAEALEFNGKAASEAQTILSLHPDNPSAREILKEARSF
jgi:eukaryotic-like serine/threonine-protein kinase